MTPARRALRAAAAILLVLGAGGPAEAESGDPEAITFDLDIPLISGGTLQAQDLRGQILVVDVWGTWCAPCRKIIPELVGIQERFGPRGVRVIGISAEPSGTLEEASRKVLRYAAEMEINYSLGIFDPKLYRWIRALMKFEEGSFTVPSTFIVDGDGRVIARYPGYFPGQEAEIARILTEALRRRDGPASPEEPPAAQEPVP